MIHYKLTLPLSGTLQEAEESVKAELKAIGVDMKVTAIPHPDEEDRCIVYIPHDVAEHLPALIGIE